MPTSLTYIILSTRGCSPWRPDAVMSTTEVENKYFPRIFTGRRERTGCFRKGNTLPATAPYLRLTRFQGPFGFKLLKRKENSSQGSRRRLRVHLCCHAGPAPGPAPLRAPGDSGQSPALGSGILTGFPFGRRGQFGKVARREDAPCPKLFKRSYPMP